ncbi:MAG: hypothetical protein Hyperionvirus2_148 [Hyperionvirus sp.]|uniref:Uncharacterized protein n=1 Tax=Hyperionvirus sp. TaxID=2487770 RepID=A0A3G5A694_9VIRU|nr:MAG: hypothetical protein Hyperionvirus2_148 [Hyperionvirus sp.]
MSQVLKRAITSLVCSIIVGWGMAYSLPAVYKTYKKNCCLYRKKSDLKYAPAEVFRISSDINLATTNDFIKQYHDLVCPRRDTHFCFWGSKSCSKNIRISIKTDGGSALCDEIISDILKRHQGNKTAYIDGDALSAGTSIALSCDLIEMHRNSCLSPIDNQIYTHALFGEKISYLKILSKPFIVDPLTLIFSIPSILNSKHTDKKNIKYLKTKHKKLNIDSFMKLFLNYEIDHSTFYAYDDLKDVGLNIRFLL